MICYYYIKHHLKCLNTWVILSYTEKKLFKFYFLFYDAMQFTISRLAYQLWSIYTERLIHFILNFLFHDTILKFNLLSKFIVYFREQGPRRYMLLATIFFYCTHVCLWIMQISNQRAVHTNKVILFLIIIMLFIIFPIIRFYKMLW